MRVASILTNTKNTLFQRNPNVFRKHPIIAHIIVSILVTVLVIGISFGIAGDLLLRDADFPISLGDGSTASVSLDIQILAIDAIAGTVTLDWYPSSDNCAVDVNLYLDPNLLDPTSPILDPTLPRSDDTPEPGFHFDNSVTYGCPNYNERNNFATFRTVSKLHGNFTYKTRSSQQAYPYDLYFTQISMFAATVGTNASAPMNVTSTFGVPVNFAVKLDPSTGDDAGGLLINLNVSRSHAVQLFVIFILLANWIVTIVFLWITIACVLWHEDIVKDMFALPIAALFAFTSVRQNMPGAPAGFGAYIDFVGILPCLVIMTICTAVLLLMVLQRRVLKEEHGKREKRRQSMMSQAEKGQASPQDVNTLHKVQSPDVMPDNGGTYLHG